MAIFRAGPILLKIKNLIFFNSLIRSFIQGYLNSAVSTTIQIGNLQTSSSSSRMLASSIGSSLDFRKTTASLLLILLIAVPFFFLFFLFRYRSRLEEKSFKDKFGALYMKQNPQKNTSLIFPLLFFLRRLSFALVLILLQNYSGIQMSLLVVINLWYLVYLVAFLPMLLPQDNMIEIVNEGTIQLILLGVNLFISDSCDSVTKEKVGKFIVGLTGANVSFNILVFIWTLVIAVRNWWRRR